MASLEDPLQLPCGATLANRIAKGAMTEGLADERCRATDRHVTLYRRWAEGGAGMLLTGNVQVDRRYLERPGNVVIEGEPSAEEMRRLEAWAASTEGTDAALWMQISHAGRQSPKIVAAEPVAPSAVEIALPGGQFARPRALEVDEIEEIIERFANVCAVARRTGFGGVQIHGAHGYLISEFLNPRVNQRTDEWGGSLENRARLLLRTVEACRLAVGEEFPVSVKLNSSDFQKGGFSFEECLQVVQWLEQAGVDLLEISGGSYESPRMMDMEGMEKDGGEDAAREREVRVKDSRRASTRRREAYFLDYAEKVAAVATRMPLMVTGGFRTRAAMDQALEGGAADVIGVARPLCVQPDAPAALLRGELESFDAPEKRLRLGPGLLGPNSPIDAVKAINGFGAMAYYYENIFRLADGEPTRQRMALLPALVRRQRREAKAARALIRD